jgi:hypothetical protein
MNETIARNKEVLALKHVKDRELHLGNLEMQLEYARRRDQ